MVHSTHQVIPPFGSFVEHRPSKLCFHRFDPVSSFELPELPSALPPWVPPQRSLPLARRPRGLRASDPSDPPSVHTIKAKSSGRSFAGRFVPKEEEALRVGHPGRTGQTGPEKKKRLATPVGLGDFYNKAQ